MSVSWIFNPLRNCMHVCTNDKSCHSGTQNRTVNFPTRHNGAIFCQTTWNSIHLAPPSRSLYKQAAHPQPSLHLLCKSGIVSNVSLATKTAVLCRTQTDIDYLWQQLCWLWLANECLQHALQDLPPVLTAVTSFKVSWKQSPICHSHSQTTKLGHCAAPKWLCWKTTKSISPSSSTQKLMLLLLLLLQH